MTKHDTRLRALGELQGAYPGDSIGSGGCRTVRGVPIYDDEYMLRCTRTQDLAATVPRRVLLQASGLCFRRGHLYRIRLLDGLRSYPEGKSGWSYLHDGGG